jgi:hypothetical protein
MGAWLIVYLFVVSWCGWWNPTSLAGFSIILVGFGFAYVESHVQLPLEVKGIKDNSADLKKSLEKLHLE